MPQTATERRPEGQLKLLLQGWCVLAAAALLATGCGGGKGVGEHAKLAAFETLATADTTSNRKPVFLSFHHQKASEKNQTQPDPAFKRLNILAPSRADATTNHIRFVADFDGDAKDDILWQTTSGSTSISFMDGSAVVNCGILGTQTDQTMGTGDFNGDGKADIVWRNMSTGAVRISLMNGATVSTWLSVGQSPIALNVKLEAVGDFDGNGRADMLWRNQSTGRSVMSYHNLDGSVSSWPVVSNYIALNTNALKVGDINGDGKDDIVWRNMGTGNVVISLMNGNLATWRGITASPISLSVALEAVGDFDNNGRADLLWRNTNTGNSLMSYHNTNGSVASWPVVSNYINPTTTSAQGVGDFDGDGKDDILWRNLSSGNTVISIMNGNVPQWAEASFTACTRLIPHSGMQNTQCVAFGSFGSYVSCADTNAQALNPQQDGHRANMNPMSFSTVGAYPITSCVKDNVTGLIWEGKTANNEPRGGGTHYTNYAFGYGKADDASGYITYVNGLNLCGFSDWRLPTRQELLEIVDFGKYEPALDSTWFPNSNYTYWTADKLGWDNGYSATVTFTSGYSGAAFASKERIRLVRGYGHTTQRYSYGTVAYGSDATNNVVIDGWTGLRWRRCEQGRTWTGATCSGTASTLTHYDALTHARDLTGWRLPNVKELASLVSLSVASGTTIDSTAFPGAAAANLWSSTPWDLLGRARYVGFADGRVSASLNNTAYPVRLVQLIP